MRLQELKDYGNIVDGEIVRTSDGELCIRVSRIETFILNKTIGSLFKR